jgi:hypothetical protein
MKKLNLFFHSFLFVLMTIPAVGQFVTGNVLYGGYDYQRGELAEIGYKGFYRLVPIDSLNGEDVAKLLILSGIKKDSILYTAAYGSSTTDKVEIFFAYKGKQARQYEDIWIRNQHHAFAGYATNSGVIIPAYNYIKADSIANLIALTYPVYSFVIKGFDYQSFIFNILAKNPKNGETADMRHIPNSVRLVPYFKELNWNRIWYNENGVQKSIVRPKTGW